MADNNALMASLAQMDKWSHEDRDILGNGLVARIMDHPAFDRFDAHKLMAAFHQCKAHGMTLDLNDPALRRGTNEKNKIHIGLNRS